MTVYFLFAGEASGDLHGSRLMQALQEKESALSFYGVGGPRMRQKGLKVFLEMEQFQVMGFSDVFKALPRLWKLFYQVLDTILKTKPACVILIDYPGFNLRLARALRQRGFTGQLVQYICPTVWAHGKKRIKILSQYFDLLLTIYPFEASYFLHTPLRVTYVGHPLVETIRTHVYQTEWKAQIGLPLNQELIALFPGSRKEELKRHIPQQLQAITHLKQAYPQLCFALSCAQGSLQEMVIDLIRQSPLHLSQDIYLVPACYNYELMRDCQMAIAKSGTVTLELALHHKPTLVHYELTPLNYLLAKYFLRLNLPHYCIVNILAKQTVFPEFIGQRATNRLLKYELVDLYKDVKRQAFMIKNCQLLTNILEQPFAHQKAAQAILELTSC